MIQHEIPDGIIAGFLVGADVEDSAIDKWSDQEVRL